MSKFFISRETTLRSVNDFSLDIPDYVAALGASAIRDYIKDNHDIRDNLEVDEDVIIFEKDEP